MEERLKSAFDIEHFLRQSLIRAKVVHFKRKETVFSKDDTADSVYYIQNGRVKLSITSQSGKEATLALLGPGNFLGEEAIRSEQFLRSTTAIALIESILIKIKKGEVLQMLERNRGFSDFLIKSLVDRIVQVQEDFAYYRLNPAEQRLARALLSLMQGNEKGFRTQLVHKISQETVAAMIGTTRPRVNLLMKRFKRLGFIECDGQLKINASRVIYNAVSKASYHKLFAFMAACVFPVPNFTRKIAGRDVVQPSLLADFGCTEQTFGRGIFRVAYFVVFVQCRNVPRYIG